MIKLSTVPFNWTAVSAVPRTCCFKAFRTGGMFYIDHLTCLNNIRRAMLMSSVLVIVFMEV